MTTIRFIDFLSTAATRIQEARHEIIAMAHRVDPQEKPKLTMVSQLVRDMAFLEKDLRDTRARVIGQSNPPAPTAGKPTNIGDPMPHGQENVVGRK